MFVSKTSGDLLPGRNSYFNLKEQSVGFSVKYKVDPNSLTHLTIQQESKYLERIMQFRRKCFSG